MKELLHRQKIGWAFVVCIAICGLLAGCQTVQDVATPTSSQVELPGQTPTVSPTTTPPPFTPAATRTPAPSKVPSITPTAMTGIHLAPEFSIVADIPGWQTSWSPAADELLALEGGNSYIGPAEGVLRVLVAPDFQPITTTVFSDFWEMGWTPSGDRVLCFCALPEFEYSRLWILEKDGGNARIVHPDLAPLSAFVAIKGWLAADQLVWQTYSGGGSSQVDLVNVATGEIIFGAFLDNSEIFAPQQGYVPAEIGTGWSQWVVAISEDYPLVNDQLDSGRTITLPRYTGEPGEDLYSTFEGWRPATTQMLIYWSEAQPGQNQALEPELLTGHLLLWDVKTNTLEALVPDAIGGSFSPDGRWLAYVSDGPAQANEAGQPRQRPTPAAGVETDTIQILEMKNQRILLSVPVITTLDDYDPFQRHSTAQASFSPDSRYLAFYSPAPLLLDPSHWPLNLDLLQAPMVTLNVLDLQAHQLVWAAAMPASEDLIWSPGSRFLLFPDQAEKWILLDTTNRQTRPLTLSGGKQVTNPQWAASGRYLSLVICQYASECEQRIWVVDLLGGLANVNSAP